MEGEGEITATQGLIKKSAPLAQEAAVTVSAEEPAALQRLATPYQPLSPPRLGVASPTPTVPSILEQTNEIDLLRRIGKSPWLSSLQPFLSEIERRGGVFIQNADTEQLSSKIWQSMRSKPNSEVSHHGEGFMEAEESVRGAIESPDFKFHDKARKSVRDAIESIFRQGLVSRDLLVDASKFIGPGSICEGNLGAYVVAHVDFTKYRRLFPPKSPLIVPERKSIRDEYIEFKIDPEGILSAAAIHLKEARAKGLELNPEQAVEIALLMISAHEYGHAIDLALKSRDIDSYQKGKALAPSRLREPDFSDKQLRQIHMERLAREVENLVVEDYLKNKLGWRDDQVSLFSSDQVIKNSAEAGWAFIDYAKQKFGWDAWKSTAVEKDFHRYFSDSVGELNILGKIAYEDTPYSEKEIRMLVTS